MILIYFMFGLALGYTLRALRVPKSPRVRDSGYTLRFPDPDATLSLEDGTRIRFGDIPRDPRTGRVDPAWLDEHCKCGEEHT